MSFKRLLFFFPKLHPAFSPIKFKLFSCIFSGKEIDPTNPWNLTGKQLDLAKSDVLNTINNGQDATK